MRSSRWMLGLALIVFAIARLESAAFAQSGDTLAKFTTNRFADTKQAVADLATAGLPDAPQILEALGSNRLLYDPATKAVYIKPAAGPLVDAMTGLPAPSVQAGSLKTVRVDNAVRGAINSAQGLVKLRSPDPAQRLAAAREMFKGGAIGALPAIRSALAAETDPSTKAALEQAQAVLVAADKGVSTQERVAAIDVIRDRGGQEALSFLDSLGPDQPASVAAAAKTALSSIKTRLTLISYAQNVWYGLSLGSVLLLAAIGLAITFGVMGVINMAHGEMVMLGAYCVYEVQQWMALYAPNWIGASLILAIPLAFVVTGAVGALIEIIVIRRLHGRPLETLLATFGLSLLIQQAVRSVFGAQNRDVITPALMSGSFRLFGLDIGWGRMWIILFALAVFAGLQILLRVTPFGLRLRAATQNRRMASSMGINTGRIDALAFALGSGVAGMAGVALSQIDNVSPNLGQSYIIDSFLVVVFGGVGNLWGTLVAAFTLGVANKLIEPAAGAVLGKIALLVIVILFIQKRPRGLFPVKGRAAEA